MGGDSTSSRAVVQNAGHAFRMKAQVIKHEFEAATPVPHLLLRCVQALMTQMTQTAACNRHHALPQQLCRWLLLSLDRLQDNDLVMTQQLMANMLCIPLDGVSAGARDWENGGMIHFADGRITVLDRAGLERLTCECYAVVKSEYDRLLPPTKAH